MTPVTPADFLHPAAWLTEDGGPLYTQLRRRIESGIDAGTLAPDTALPPERDLAALTGLSRVTVRKAIADLAARGLVVQRQGSGSWIAPQGARVEQQLTRLTSFSEDMARRGLVTENRWLERGLFLPGPEERAALDLPEDAQVARLARLRLADGRPMAIERASLSPEVLPNPLVVQTSLYEVLGASGHAPVRAVQRITAVNIAADEAALLGLPPGAAGLSITRLSYLADGRVVEFTRSLYRGDAYDFVAELQVAEA